MYDWLYIGEAKEGTDHIPHGIGIQVGKYGDIKEGYWKEGKLQGSVRANYLFLHANSVE